MTKPQAYFCKDIFQALLPIPNRNSYFEPKIPGLIVDNALQSTKKNKTDLNRPVWTKNRSKSPLRGIKRYWITQLIFYYIGELILYLLEITCEFM